MAASTYKCPSCGGYLAFDPETQKWKCPFCDSVFDESVVMDKDEPEKQPAEAHQVVYRCQNCGSEIMTDETTVASQCYYCHSPVVLQGKLTNDMRPDAVIPFKVSKELTVQIFMRWVHGKKYVPKDFFKQAQVEGMTGVYYPYFVSDLTMKGTAEGDCQNVDVTTTSREVITRTDYYRVKRKADATFHNIMRPALRKANRKLSDGIHPFPMEEAVAFSDAYLTGFLAERRDMETSEIEPDVQREAEGYMDRLVRESVNYDRKNLNVAARTQKINTSYVLLPTWVLTYPNKQNKDEPYYYAINGCTSDLCGKLPIDRKKLYTTAAGIGAVVFFIACILCYFVF